MRAEKELSCFLSEYAERNDENVYPPVAVGRYGIRARESIYTKELAKDYSKNKLIFRNTLTVGMGSVQIDIGVLTDDKVYSVSPAYHTFRVSGINADYLRYCLECRNRDMFARYVKRGSRQGKSIDLKRWLTYQIPVYFDAEQQEIVSRLDAVSRQIEARRAELDLLGNLVKSRFVEMFGDLRSNEYYFPVATMEDITTGINDGEHGKVQRAEDGPLFLSARSIGHGVLDYESAAHVTPSEFERISRRFNPTPGDVVLTCTGTIGRAAIVGDVPFVCDRDVALIKPDRNRVLSEYLLGYFQSDDALEQMGQLTHTVTIAHLYLGKIKAMKLLTPPLEWQQEFADFVAQVDKSRSVVQRSIAQLELLKASLMQEYFG